MRAKRREPQAYVLKSTGPRFLRTPRIANLLSHIKGVEAGITSIAKASRTVHLKPKICKSLQIPDRCPRVGDAWRAQSKARAGDGTSGS